MNQQLVKSVEAGAVAQFIDWQHRSQGQGQLDVALSTTLHCMSIHGNSTLSLLELTLSKTLYCQWKPWSLSKPTLSTTWKILFSSCLTISVSLSLVQPCQWLSMSMETPLYSRSAKQPLNANPVATPLFHVSSVCVSHQAFNHSQDVLLKICCCYSCYDNIWHVEFVDTYCTLFYPWNLDVQGKKKLQHNYNTVKSLYYWEYLVTHCKLIITILVKIKL